MKLPCKKCSKEFTTAAKLKIHQKIHKDTQRECDICHKMFSNKLNLDGHRRKFHLTAVISYFVINMKINLLTSISQRRGWALTTTLRTPSRQLPQVGLKKEQPCQMLLLSAFPADALSRVTEN